MAPRNREPTPPGVFLKRIIEETEGLTQDKLATQVGVGVQTINMIINGRRNITADMALRLARVFDMTPEFWMNAQAAVDLWRARHEQKTAAR